MKLYTEAGDLAVRHRDASWGTRRHEE